MTKSPEVRIIVTEDGSHSLEITSLNETYHSTHGAIQESRYVFIKQGLEFAIDTLRTPLRILEVGFGTGLNALLSFEHCKIHPSLGLEYVALEPFPLQEDVINVLNYPSFGLDESAFSQIHRSEWNMATDMGQFHFKKVNSRIEDFESDISFDLIYFDAFAPGKQPEIWSQEVFEKIFSLMSHNGILTTYSAQGQFRRTLRDVGFDIESLPGPPGKHEMTRAVKRG
jgi:tRNA U34 5-methylaminomethyl-2-thiouridine-forming methyltransferase MnmC